MKSISVNSERSYQIKFCDDIWAEVAKVSGDRKVAVITPVPILKLIQSRIPKQYLIIEVEEGEAQKSLTTFGRALEILAEAKFDRSTLILGIGGGATTDLAGFLAASYLRGVDWVAIPTSLAAMVDAAVGGKTGLNLQSGKNLVGAFYSPIEVLIDMTFLDSLSDRDLAAGMAEVAKCGFISDTSILPLISSGWKKNLAELIYKSIAVKALVVSSDFKESRLREILNYGHTLGHAIEKHGNYRMRHGECVALGLRFAAELSHSFSGLSRAERDQHNDVLNLLNLEKHYPAAAWPELLEIMRRDKKVREGQIRFVTLKGLGEPTRAENLSDNELAKAYLESIGR